MRRFWFTTFAAVSSLAASGAASAAEAGAGFYLLGSKGPTAAVTPPPGVFFSNDVYVYSGDLGGGKALPTGGRLAVGVDGTAVIDVPTVLWVLPDELLGGRVGLSATVPFGWKNTEADLTLTGPRGRTFTGDTGDTVFTVGDPVLGASLGWEAGNFHWQAGVLVNVPVGDYQDDELSNLSFNHWGADVSGSVTWLDPMVGLDLSAVVGMTFNAENPATDYRTGDEFHVEWAAVQHFSPKFDAGFVGYYYKQVSGDSGEGASGPFKGEVTAIGATVGYTFEAGELPVSTRLKYFHEFSAENRAEGDAFYATLSIPLSVTKPKTTVGAVAED